MELQDIAAELRLQLRDHPYRTIAAMVGAGWILGRSLPLRDFLALAGLGARVAMAAVLEDAMADRARP